MAEEKEDCCQTKHEEHNDSPSNLLVSPPDGGWGWVVVFGGGLAISIVTGFTKSVTLFYEELLQVYGQSASATAWLISITGTIRMLSSPLVSVLCNRFSHRAVGMASALMMATAYLSAAFIPSLYGLYFTYAIFHGFGATMLLLPNVTMVNMYFSKNRGKANAISTCFNGFGPFYMAPLLTFLFSEYGYKGALIIMAALSLNQIPAASLFRPLTKKVTASVKEEMPIPAADNKTDIEQSGMSSKQISYPNNGSKCSDLPRNRTSKCNDKITEEQRPDETLLPNSPLSDGMDKRTASFLQRTHQHFRKCSSVLGLGGLKNANLRILCFLMASFGIINTCNNTLLAGLALEKGFIKSQVTIMMSISAAVAIGFRLLAGVVFDLKFVRSRRPLMLGFVGGFAGILTAVIPFVPGVIPSMVTWALMQGLQGSYQSQSNTVMADIVDRSKITSSYGILRLIQGLGNLLGPLLGGLSLDISGSYRYGYLISGSQFSIACTLFTIYYLNHKRKVSR